MNALPVLLILLLATTAFAGPVTNAPDATHGQELASKLCSNCHLVGSGQQEQANADVPSFHEIANKQGQIAGAIMAHIVRPSTQCRQSQSQRVNLPTFPPTFSA